ncbi:MAG TPA: hypothetical protein VKX28_21595 [Xanthobacteraceae bacterium]|nr:hypothetical protein [Xanthobacteraceae bacterium]
MTLSLRLLAGTLIAAGFIAAHAAPGIPVPKGPSPAELALQAKCRAASFARRPAGQMSTTMRDYEIKLCMKAGGVLY